MHLNNGLDIPPRNRDILETSILEILRTYNASLWLPGPGSTVGNYEDSLGVTPLSTVNNVVGYVTDEESDGEAENYVYNTDFSSFTIGGIPGAPYSRHNVSGIISNVVGIGTEDGVPYVDMRMSGTSVSASPMDCIVLEPSQTLVKLFATAGEVVTGSFYIKVLEIAEPITRIIQCNVTERAIAGGFITNTALNLDLSTIVGKTRISISRLVTSASTAHVTFSFRLIAAQLGDAIDFTVRLYQFQLNRGNLAPFAENTTGAALVRTTSYIPAYQATTGFKPVLTGGVTNHVRKGLDTTDGTYWFASTGVTKESFRIVNGLGTVAVLRNIDTVAQHSIRIYNTTTAFPENIPVELVMHVRYISGDPIVGFQFKNNAGGFGSILTFNAMTGVIVTGTSAGSFLRVEKAVEGFWRCTFSADSSGAGAGVANLICYFNSGATVLGSTEDMIEVGGGMMPTGELPYYGPLIPSGATGLTYSDTVPYSWKFDGVDDRLVVAKPTIDQASGDCFRVICHEIPMTAPVGADIIMAGTNNSISGVRLGQLGLSGASSLQVSWVDDAAVNGSPSAILRTIGETVVNTITKTAGSVKTHKIRGDLLASATTSSAVVIGSTTATNERIGCHAPLGADANFFTGKIYGIISGKGLPTAGELTAMEDFLAGCAGVTLLP